MLVLLVSILIRTTCHPKHMGIRRDGLDCFFLSCEVQFVSEKPKITVRVVFLHDYSLIAYIQHQFGYSVRSDSTVWSRYSIFYFHLSISRGIIANSWIFCLRLFVCGKKDSSVFWLCMSKQRRFEHISITDLGGFFEEQEWCIWYFYTWKFWLILAK